MIKLEINGQMRTFDVTDDVPPLWALRDVAHMTGGVGEAGAAGVGRRLSTRSTLLRDDASMRCQRNRTC